MHCCGSGSGRIRNFFLDPELFVSDPDPARMKDQINIYRRLRYVVEYHQYI